MVSRKTDDVLCPGTDHSWYSSQNEQRAADLKMEPLDKLLRSA